MLVQVRSLSLSLCKFDIIDRSGFFVFFFQNFVPSSLFSFFFLGADLNLTKFDINPQVRFLRVLFFQNFVSSFFLLVFFVCVLFVVFLCRFESLHFGL